jgi:hypothetical protein
MQHIYRMCPLFLWERARVRVFYSPTWQRRARERADLLN